MLNLNQGIALFRQTQTLRPKKTQQVSQQGLLFTMFPLSTLTELKFISCRYLILND